MQLSSDIILPPATDTRSRARTYNTTNQHSIPTLLRDWPAAADIHHRLCYLSPAKQAENISTKCCKHANPTMLLHSNTRQIGCKLRILFVVNKFSHNFAFVLCTFFIIYCTFSLLPPKMAPPYYKSAFRHQQRNEHENQCRRKHKSSTKTSKTKCCYKTWKREKTKSEFRKK